MMNLKLKKLLLKILSFLLIFLIAVPINIEASSEYDPLDKWHWRNPLPTGNSLQDVAYGNSIYVAVGDKGTILTSEDGDSWVSQDSGVYNDLRGIVYGEGIFVVVGSEVILVSVDGMTWQEHNNISFSSQNYNYYLNDVTYGNDRFVAIGYADNGTRRQKTILTSRDGLNWTAKSTTKELLGITYGKNKFIAVGKKGNDRYAALLTSSDGVNWTNRTSGSRQDLYDVAYGNNTFVATAINGVIYSTDGISWSSFLNADGLNLKGITYGNGIFVAVGSDGIIISDNGRRWTVQQAEYGANGVGYGNNRFIAVSDNGIIQTSADGTNWDNYNEYKNTIFNNLTHGNNRFVAVGNNGVIFTSPDGSHWTEQNSGVNQSLSDTVYGNNKFVAVGNNGTIITSVNGVNWSSQTLGRTENLNSIAYGNGKFVAVGGSPTWSHTGIILTSTDGVNWRIQSLNNHLYAVVYGDSKFVAQGNGKVYISTDGINWRSHDLDSNTAFYDIAYGNNKFVAVEGSGSILTSSDGINWRSRGQSNLMRITYDNGIFAAVGGKAIPDSDGKIDGIILTSTDGVNWKQRPSINSDNLRGIAYGNNTFAAVGENETIIQSDPLTNQDVPQIYFNPIGGLYHSPISVSILTSEPATIYYTVDGSDPRTSRSRLEYVSPIRISTEGTVTFRVIAIDLDGNQSPVHSQTYTLDLTTPTASANPTGGVYYVPQNVTLMASEQATIYYTLDGRNPTTNSTRYTNPISIINQGTTILKFMAVDNDGNRSVIYTERYILDFQEDSENLIVIKPPLGKEKAFKQGRSIPVKFKLLSSGQSLFTSNSEFRLYLAEVTNGNVGEEFEAASVSNANKGNLFRYDRSERQFIFNLNTKVLTKGTWQLRIELDDNISVYLTIILR